MKTLLLSWWLVGVIASLASFFQFLGSWVLILLVLPLLASFHILHTFLTSLGSLSQIERWLCGLIIAIWVMHGLGLLVPDVSFDSVWYHLPVLSAIKAQGGLLYLPETYQSLNPLFGDLILLLGTYINPWWGAQLISYYLGLTLIGVVYVFARQFLSRFWALWVVIQVSLFQVITWQVSTAYVDLIKMLWDLGWLWFLLQWQQKDRLSDLFGAIVFFSASLATKAFSVLLLPLFSFLLLKNYWYKEKSLVGLLGLLSSITLASPFYIRAFIYTGDPFFVISTHLNKLAEIGGDGSLFSFLWQRLLLLPMSPITLLFARDYISPLVCLSLLFIGWSISKTKQNAKWYSLLFFSLMHWLIWWLVPPLSTRYALAGFIGIFILGMKEMSIYLSRKVLISLCLLTTSFLLAPRIWVSAKKMTVILGEQTPTEYIQAHYDGWIDPHLKTWYQL